MGGLIIGLIAIPLFKLISEKLKQMSVDDDDPTEVVVISDNEMVAIIGFDEGEYTSKYFSIAEHSILTDNDWNCSLDYREILFYKRESKRSDSPQLTMKIDYHTENGLFKVRSSRLSSSRGTYSTDYTISGELSKELITLAYKKYVEWVNRKNEEKKLEIDKKLETFQSVLGKAAERDMKLDELLNSK